MKVTVLSMSHAKVYTPNNKAAIIRIVDGGYELDELQHYYDHKLELSFYDIVPRTGLPSNWNWFNKSDGEKVIEFFSQIKDCDELVIHCYAGISRSPAIALSYGWFTSNEKIVNQIKDGNYLPNSQVLNIMSRLIFEDRKVARNKLLEVEKHFKELVEANKHKEIIF